MRPIARSHFIAWHVVDRRSAQAPGARQLGRAGPTASRRCALSSVG